MTSREDPLVKQEDDDDANEEFDETNYKTQNDAILFAIDVSPTMLERPPPPATKSKSADRDSAVSAALRCACQIMQQRIISQPKDRMGILFFGTEKSKFRTVDDDDEGGGSGGGDGDSSSLASVSQIAPYPHCYLFLDLDVPAAEDVRALKNIVEGEEDPDEVLTAAPAGKTVAMANVLFCANQIFTTNAPNFGSRRLFIITDNDNPHPGDKAARSAAAVRAKDLYDLGVAIELFPITRGDAKFDLTKFYDDIIYRDPTTEEGLSSRVLATRTGNGLTLLGSLISNINAKQTPKRAYFSNLTFEIAPGLDISVNGYIMLNHQKPARTCYVWTQGEVPQLVTSETIQVDEESTRTVETGETKKAYKFGGEYVYFTPEERDTLKKWDFPEGWKGKGLRIIGFKPRVMIPLWASVKKSIFIYPSEKDYVGSTRVFSALWQKLKKSEKVGIAWFVPRINANPVLVAMIPSDGPDGGPEAERDHANPMRLPAGLWLYPLPFAEDIRKFDDSRAPPPRSEELTEMMKPVVENLFLPKMTYNPAKYPNPALQWHYTILQKNALEEEMPDMAEDLTLPKYKAIAKRVGGSLAEIKDLIKSESTRLMTTRAFKREAEDDSAGMAAKPLSKRPKTTSSTDKGKDGGADTISAKDLRAAVENNKLATKTVSELKFILASKGLSSSGKKAELVERIEQWVDENL